MEDLRELWNELITPDEVLDTVYQIDFMRLKKKNINALLIDLDNTLLGRYENEPSLKCQGWVESAKKAGFSLCISSNSFYPNRLRHITSLLEIPGFFLAVKPLPWALQIAAQRILKVPSSQVALVGDQLFTDVLGGNLADMYTIMVHPFEAERSSSRRFMRSLERVALKGCGATAAVGRDA